MSNKSEINKNMQDQIEEATQKYIMLREKGKAKMKSKGYNQAEIDNIMELLNSEFQDNISKIKKEYSIKLKEYSKQQENNTDQIQNKLVPPVIYEIVLPKLSPKSKQRLAERKKEIEQKTKKRMELLKLQGQLKRKEFETPFNLREMQQTQQPPAASATPKFARLQSVTKTKTTHKKFPKPNAVEAIPVVKETSEIAQVAKPPRETKPKKVKLAGSKKPIPFIPTLRLKKSQPKPAQTEAKKTVLSKAGTPVTRKISKTIEEANIQLKDELIKARAQFENYLAQEKQKFQQDLMNREEMEVMIEFLREEFNQAVVDIRGKYVHPRKKLTHSTVVTPREIKASKFRLASTKELTPHTPVVQLRKPKHTSTTIKTARKQTAKSVVSVSGRPTSVPAKPSKSIIGANVPLKAELIKVRAKFENILQEEIQKFEQDLMNREEMEEMIEFLREEFKQTVGDIREKYGRPRELMIQTDMNTEQTMAAYRQIQYQEAKMEQIKKVGERRRAGIPVTPAKSPKAQISPRSKEAAAERKQRVQTYLDAKLEKAKQIGELKKAGSLSYQIPKTPEAEKRPISREDRQRQEEIRKKIEQKRLEKMEEVKRVGAYKRDGTPIPKAKTSNIIIPKSAILTEEQKERIRLKYEAKLEKVKEIGKHKLAGTALPRTVPSATSDAIPSTTPRVGQVQQRRILQTPKVKMTKRPQSYAGPPVRQVREQKITSAKKVEIPRKVASEITVEQRHKNAMLKRIFEEENKRRIMKMQEVGKRKKQEAGMQPTKGLKLPERIIQREITDVKILAKLELERKKKMDKMKEEGEKRKADAIAGKIKIKGTKLPMQKISSAKTDIKQLEKIEQYRQAKVARAKSVGDLKKKLYADTDFLERARGPVGGAIAKPKTPAAKSITIDKKTLRKIEEKKEAALKKTKERGEIKRKLATMRSQDRMSQRAVSAPIERPKTEFQKLNKEKRREIEEKNRLYNLSKVKKAAIMGEERKIAAAKQYEKTRKTDVDYEYQEQNPLQQILRETGKIEMVAKAISSAGEIIRRPTDIRAEKVAQRRLEAEAQRKEELKRRDGERLLKRKTTPSKAYRPTKSKLYKKIQSLRAGEIAAALEQQEKDISQSDAMQVESGGQRKGIAMSIMLNDLEISQILADKIDQLREKGIQRRPKLLIVENIFKSHGPNMPTWFPGYYCAFPSNDGDIEEVKNPKEALVRAWSELGVHCEKFQC